jgi:phosphoesterase RecJ-like protein
VAENPSIINIDHHISNDGFGGVSYVEVNASSVCEILYRFVHYMDIPSNREIAFALYTGIMTDTGRFRFTNTTADVLNIAADMISCGADPAVIAENVYYNLDRNTIEALGKTLTSIEFYADDRLVVMEYHNPDELIDTEGFIDIAVGIKGVRAVVYIRLIPEDGRYKVSLRGRNGFDVRELAESYGGGGHQSAAGFRYRGSLIELKEKLISQIIAMLNTS